MTEPLPPRRAALDQIRGIVDRLASQPQVVDTNRRFDEESDVPGVAVEATSDVPHSEGSDDDDPRVVSYQVTVVAGDEDSRDRLEWEVERALHQVDWPGARSNERQRTQLLTLTGRKGVVYVANLFYELSLSR